MGHAPRRRLAGSIGRDARTGEPCWPRWTSTISTPTTIVGRLSVGNRQRVEILRALSQDARVFIMDEPTAALTEHDVRGCSTSCRRLRARGVGIVYISHRMDEIFAIADRVTVLRDGACSAPGGFDTNSRRTGSHDGWPAIESAVPEDRRPDRRCRLEVRDLVASR